MDDYLKEALEIVKAQASVRTMAEDDIVSMVKKVADGIKAVAEGCTSCANEQTSQIAWRIFISFSIRSAGTYIQIH